MASILVIARAALESCLVFHDVFVTPKDDYELSFRRDARLLAGSVLIEKYPPNFLADQQAAEKQIAENQAARGRLRSNPNFFTLTPKQQEAVLRGEQWRSNSFSRLSENVFGEQFGGVVYSYLSSWVHMML